MLTLVVGYSLYSLPKGLLVLVVFQALLIMNIGQVFFKPPATAAVDLLALVTFGYPAIALKQI